MKQMKCLIWLIIIALICACSLCSCEWANTKTDEKDVDNEEKIMGVNIKEVDPAITRFYFTYSSGNDGQAYGISANSRGYLFIDYLLFGVIYLGNADQEVSIPLSYEKYYELEQLITKYDLKLWNSFQNDKIEAADSGGYRLEIVWSDGTSVLSYGHGTSPENFVSVYDALANFFKPYKNSIQ